jgi:hypothetical protein
MHDSFNVKNSTLILRSSELVLSSVSVKLSLPLRRMLLSLSVVPNHPRFVTSNYNADKVGVVVGLFLELSTDSNAVIILITAQEPWDKFCCNALHAELISDKIRRQVPYDSPTS